MRQNLQQLQTLLYQLITTLQPEECISDGCGQASEEVEGLICGDGSMSADSRVNVYLTLISTGSSNASMRNSQTTLSGRGPRQFLGHWYATTCWYGPLRSPQYFTLGDICPSSFAIIPWQGVGPSSRTWQSWNGRFWRFSMPRMLPL